MLISITIDKERVAKVEYIAAHPILWSRWPKSGEEMNATTYICKWDNTANPSTISVSKGRNVV